MPNQASPSDANNDAGDRRGAKRERIEASASLFSVDPARAVVLVDLSTSGCRLRGQSLPEMGTDVWLKAGDVHLYGKIVWGRDAERGIAFDEAVGEEVMEQLRDFRIHQLGQHRPPA